jgi:hypothetical protein
MIVTDSYRIRPMVMLDCIRSMESDAIDTIGIQPDDDHPTQVIPTAFNLKTSISL